ncbi:hypothetical protein CHGG_08517 [Chaetomium globosum CBS 148.51]|uniref:Uncharacterized protein n=1 Tax=Chaetomium globosum (strain ATCC 6205 / CBS 148.51 / DSM 1962 / NBRC 6347 / NRRL 1970) TaxID=306901 RepID=Q2GU37_CHAGB|nr:uncharacterized protein CHGG_08517 [Chaetomium globosum CBS 148.51]EAQ84503.1 hypothetical protein CHGG_08517 [Chaetomium globosum CBS 148.51]
MQSHPPYTVHRSQAGFQRICRRQVGLELISYARIAPLDGTYGGPETEYQTLIKQFNIPDEFVWERETSVTHSFGRQSDEDGRDVLWMHFLGAVPSMDSLDRQPEWLKSGFILTWLPRTAQARRPLNSSSAPPEVTQMTYTVGLLLFSPPVEALQRLVEFVKSPRWRTATFDPYVLVDIALVAWYHRIDKVAWDVTNLIRAEEEDIFQRARKLKSTAESVVTDLDLHRIHTSAKNAIFTIEALDAAIRLVDSTLSNHELFGQSQRGDRLWENTHRLLHHRRELFHSTKLRTVSCQARIKNTIDLAFHINTAHDSQVNLHNSRSVRLISIVGLVFIPFTAVTSIFGTQFFDYGEQHMDVNPDFWILWVIALPLTLVIMTAWRASEHDTLQWPSSPARLSLARWRKDRGWSERDRGSGATSGATELRNVGLRNV